MTRRARSERSRFGRAVRSLWRRGIASTFAAGVFVLLPLVLTLAIAAWVARRLADLVGPETVAGGLLRDTGLRFVTDERLALLLGWVLVLAGVFAVGLVARITARHRLEAALSRWLGRIPLVGTVYRPVSRVVELFKREGGELERMSVVFCRLGGAGGAGLLGLQASPREYEVDGRRYQIVYLPTSPVPMSGGVLFVPSEAIEPVAMGVDTLLGIYFSLGALAPDDLPLARRGRTPDPPPPRAGPRGGDPPGTGG